jgi:CheY-like chemotaxis protein
VLLVNALQDLLPIRLSNPILLIPASLRGRTLWCGGRLTGIPGRAADALRLDAVDYLLKPLDPEQVEKAVNRLLAYLSLNLR